MHILHFKNQKGETSLMQTIMVAALIVAAFFIGMLWTQVKNYEKNAGIQGNKLGSTGGVNDADAPDFGNAPNPNAKIELDPVTDKDHVRGNRSARVALVEYSDLECPFCKSFHPTAKQMLSSYGDKVMWVYRHFPLDQLHSKARNEAAASECVAKLGGEDKFWAFIDKVYEVTPANNGLDPNQLPEIATQVGVDKNKFNDCLTSKETTQLVSDQYSSGLKAGISGTPGNILLDTKTGKTTEVPGAVPFEQLKTMIDSFIAGLE
jgi:protein-disulfide isomerase